MDPVGESDAGRELLDEALERAEQARRWLEEAASGLGSAGSWALFDLLGGRWFFARRKYEHLDQVRGHLRRSQRELRRLDECCEELGIAPVGLGPEGPRRDSRARTIDTWFDNPFSAFRVHRQVGGLKRSVGEALGRLEAATEELVRRAGR